MGSDERAYLQRITDSEYSVILWLLLFLVFSKSKVLIMMFCMGLYVYGLCPSPNESINCIQGNQKESSGTTLMQEDN